MERGSRGDNRIERAEPAVLIGETLGVSSSSDQALPHACCAARSGTPEDGGLSPERVLLHVCCAPCSIACVDSLRGEGIVPTAYWYNPNIHPFTEYRARRDTLREYAKQIGLELVEQDDYGLRPFLTAVNGAFDDRCPTCYRLRLNAAAAYAAAHGFAAFTTTLLISPYQDHALLIEAGERAAAQHGVAFLYRDFRPLFREGQRQARELGLYMQKYCGCVFSEEDRYRKKK